MRANSDLNSFQDSGSILTMYTIFDMSSMATFSLSFATGSILEIVDDPAAALDAAMAAPESEETP